VAAPPIYGGRFGPNMGKLVQGQPRGTAPAPSGGDVRPSEALRAWGDVAAALSTRLPTALLHVGALDASTRRALRGKGRRR
jgi:hypothetical protein